MGLKKTNVGFRVEVEPPRPWRDEDDNWIADCGAIAGQIRRHIDGLDERAGRFKGVNVVWDVELECEHCGYRWTEGEDSPHNGSCCAKDERVRLQTEAAT